LDAAKLTAARAGDRDARAVLLRELEDPWYRMCLSLLGNADEARDATQETALRFLKQLAGFRGESQLRTWSLGIALNVVREMKRTAGRTTLVADAERIAGEFHYGGEVSPVDAVEATEAREALRHTLTALPERQREAIVLRFFEDLSVEDTATLMRCAPGTVKATVHQALRSLRHRMGQLVVA
jgi:RNA polymerase sigma-70 factor (ECF subfamily)